MAKQSLTRFTDLVCILISESLNSCPLFIGNSDELRTCLIASSNSFVKFDMVLGSFVMLVKGHLKSNAVKCEDHLHLVKTSINAAGVTVPITPKVRAPERVTAKSVVLTLTISAAAMHAKRV